MIPAEIAPNPDVLATNRGRVGDRYYLMSPDTMVENSLPFLPPYSAVVLAAPQGTTARFGQTLLTLEDGAASTGELGDGFENFLFVVEGALDVHSPAAGDDPAGAWALRREGFLFLPEGRTFGIRAAGATRVLWVKKRYTAVPGLGAPEIVHGDLGDVAGTDDAWIDGSYGQCLPDDARYDMAMNIMRFREGARFRMNEIHHQEHGLYLLSGGGVYHLDGDHLEVRADDFIYMAPYCTQAFTVAGAGETAYLLYKDVNRDGF
ncbi:hypothetical protein D3248_14015 [Leucobacter zeae]|nr:hypothetical protein [Leucobacter zeae]